MRETEELGAVPQAEKPEEPAAPYAVKLTYFKESGKYYTDGEYVSNQPFIHRIFEEVADMKRAGRLPGFCEGHGSYIVLVDVQDHPHRHPHLVI